MLDELQLENSFAASPFLIKGLRGQYRLDGRCSEEDLLSLFESAILVIFFIVPYLLMKEAPSSAL